MVECVIVKSATLLWSLVWVYKLFAGAKIFYGKAEKKKIVCLPSPYLPKEILPTPKILLEFLSARFFFLFQLL